MDEINIGLESFVGIHKQDPSQKPQMMRYDTNPNSLGLEMRDITIEDFYSNDLDLCLENAIEKMLKLSKPNTTTMEKNKVSYTNLLILSNTMVQKTRRAPANFVVGRKDLVQQLFSVHGSPSSRIEYFEGVNYARCARYTILIKDLEDRVLIGYKGKSATDSGVMIIERDSSVNRYAVCIGPAGAEDYYTQIRFT